MLPIFHLHCALTRSTLSFRPQGKFIRINFDVTGYIVGANIETCILSVWNCVYSSPLHCLTIEKQGRGESLKLLAETFILPLLSLSYEKSQGLQLA